MRFSNRRALLPLLVLFLAAGGCGGHGRPRAWVTAAPQTVRHATLRGFVAYAFTLRWAGVNVTGKTGYYLTLNGVRQADVSSGTSAYTFSGLTCGQSYDFGVQAHDNSTHTSQVYTATRAVVCPLSALHVSGSQLLNARNTPVVLHGVDRAGTEYSCEQGTGFFDGTGTDQTAENREIQNAASWGFNTFFIGLNEDCWLGINGVQASLAGANYQAMVQHYVQAIETQGMYPVIGWFWGAPGTNLAVSQEPMPDNDHAPLFWEEVASTFKTDPYVIFRAKEEPLPGGSGVAQWQCWSQGDVSYAAAGVNTPPTPPTSSGTPDKCSTGGYVVDDQGRGGAFTAIGMQSIVNIIRGAGAGQIIQIPGVDFANHLSCDQSTSPVTCGYLDTTDSIKVADTLTPAQLMADVDVYPDSNQCGTTACWNTTYQPVATVEPLIAGETGEASANAVLNASQAAGFLNWSDQHDTGYYAWAWDPWADLINAYNDPSPQAPWGVTYKNWIEASGVPVNVVAPAISGTLRQGQTVSVNTGSWSPDGGPVAFQWQSCTAGSCTNLTGQTSNTYTLAETDIGNNLRVQLTYGNQHGTDTVTTAQAGPVLAIAQPTGGITFPQTVTKGCVGDTPGQMTFSKAVAAGDDLFVVIGGLSFGAAGMNATGVSDNVNGGWTQLVNSSSQQGDGSGKYVEYAVYEKAGSAAASAGALTLTVTHDSGPANISAVAVDASGVTSVTASSFNATIRTDSVDTSNLTFSGPTLTSVAAGDVVMGLFGSYVNDTSNVGSYSAPSGWNTAGTYWVRNGFCGGAAFDWTQPGTLGSVASQINSSETDYYYGGGVELHH